MSILILGKNGKLAQTFQRKLPDAIALGRQDFDLQDQSIRNVLDRYQPSTIINCVAYTDVDGAETHRDLAYSINATAVGNLAQICHHNLIKLVHFSTDYVFSGDFEFNYSENEQPSPANYYGYTKLAGEILALYNNPETLIIRFSSPFGREFHDNFPSKVIAMLKNGMEIQAVESQWFLPTWSDDLVDATLKLLQKKISGRVHFCNQGKPVSPYQYAVYVAELLGCPKDKITNIPRTLRPANRPFYSELNTELYQNLIESPRMWKDALKEYLATQ